MFVVESNRDLKLLSLDFEKLIIELRNDKKHAIECLYHSFFPEVKRYILSNQGDVDETKDVFQDAMIIFLRKLKEGKINKDNFKGYFLAITKSRWIDYVKKRNKHFSMDSSSHDMYGYEESNTLSDLYSADTSKMVNEVLSSMGDRCKELLSMVLFFNASMKEVSKKMNFSSEDSAKTQHYKCRKKLMELYQNNLELKKALQGVS